MISASWTNGDGRRQDCLAVRQPRSRIFPRGARAAPELDVICIGYDGRVLKFSSLAAKKTADFRLQRGRDEICNLKSQISNSKSLVPRLRCPFIGAAVHFFGRHVFLVRADAPDVAEGVHELAVA